VTASSAVARAVAAACAVARAHGVACDDAAVLASHSNVLVHLTPSPVVARVMSGTAMLHDDVEAWLRREVAVGRFLGDRGLSVPPTSLMPAGPHRHDGLWMTFWEFVEHDESSLPSARELGSSLRQLHEALAGYRGDLGRLGEVGDWLARLAAGNEELRTRLEQLRPAVFESSLPVQAIHADAAVSALFRTQHGLLWNDFEDVCLGPVQWDVGGLVAEARDRGEGEAYVDEFLAAYGGLQLEELRDFIEAHELYAAIWHAFNAQRR
jgi:hypothetical protein